MKLFKLIALSATLTIGTFGLVTYTSCSKDPCKNVVCDHGGTCSSGNCTCPTGYLGTSCDGYAFIGKWDGSDVCTPGSTTYTQTISIDSSSSGITTVLINNPVGFGTNNTISGTLSSDGKTITYTNQIVNASTAPDTLTGTMVLTDNTHFTHNVSFREASGSYICNGNYSKQ